MKMGYDTFEILGGIVTLYRRNIEFTIALGNWLKNNHAFYCNSNLELDENLKESTIRFHDVWEAGIERLVSMHSFVSANTKILTI